MIILCTVERGCLRSVHVDGRDVTDQALLLDYDNTVDPMGDDLRDPIAKAAANYIELSDEYAEAQRLFMPASPGARDVEKAWDELKEEVMAHEPERRIEL